MRQVTFHVDVWVSLPTSSRLGGTLTYSCESAPNVGSLVRVPLGKRLVLGVVASCQPAHLADHTRELKPIVEVWREIPPLSEAWMELMRFVHRYYQRPVGEVAIAALPPAFKKETLAKVLRWSPSCEQPAPEPVIRAKPILTEAQAHAVKCLDQSTQPVLLFGVTGSGKTEVYLQSIEQMLQQTPEGQALLLVPEINLTPALTRVLTDRFGADHVAVMHSSLTPVQRAKQWLKAHHNQVRVVLGTRLSVFASLPQLRLIVVDEEHDPSYKSQDGARYSARDLALMRAQLEQRQGKRCQVMLGSATPSLETWWAAEQGRYLRVELPDRMGQARWPSLKLANMSQEPWGTVLGREPWQALQACVQRGEQALILLNRRGYAPVMYCPACGWKSACPHCSAFRVFHKRDGVLRCHHCSSCGPVPTACPECQHDPLQPMGLGTEQMQEWLETGLQSLIRPDGRCANVLRVDSDSSRSVQGLADHLQAIHEGEADVLVGTQMLAKGHDFRRVSLVIAVNPDSALYSADYRAPERLFALLIQAAGRAGRDAEVQTPPVMWVQTQHPQHPLFAFLSKHDVSGFLNAELNTRRQAGLAPFVHQALVRAEAHTQQQAQWLLQSISDRLPNKWMHEHGVMCYPPLPMSMARVDNVERVHMLLECEQRKPLLALLPQVHELIVQTLDNTPKHGVLRYAIDVDPLSF
ncbi:MAG: hypothetical protein RLZZ397_1472 [Pseudomonadota bacterium]